MTQRRAVGLEARTMRAKPRCMAAAAGKCPCAGDAPAALDAHRLRTRSHAPGQHVALATEHFARDTRLEISGRHRATGTLVHAPGDRGIAARDRFHALDVGRWIKFRATDRARHQQSEHALAVHRVQHIRRQLACFIDARSSRGQQRRQPARPRDVVGRSAGLVHVHRIVPRMIWFRTLHPARLGAQSGDTW